MAEKQQQLDQSQQFLEVEREQMEGLRNRVIAKRHQLNTDITKAYELNNRQEKTNNSTSLSTESNTKTVRFAETIFSLSPKVSTQSSSEIFYDVSVIAQAQKQLTDLGYKPGPIDGIMGFLTKKALKNFQTDWDLNISGNLDYNTLATLRNTLHNKTYSLKNTTVNNIENNISHQVNIPEVKKATPNTGTGIRFKRKSIAAQINIPEVRKSSHNTEDDIVVTEVHVVGPGNQNVIKSYGPKNEFIGFKQMGGIPQMDGLEGSSHSISRFTAGIKERMRRGYKAIQSPSSHPGIATGWSTGLPSSLPRGESSSIGQNIRTISPR